VRVSTLSTMRTLPLAISSQPYWFLLVFVQRIEEVLEENMEWKCFGMIVGSIWIPE
jgi:hypothetical protein